MEVAFLSVIEDHIAGDPMNEKVRWVKLTRYQISDAMREKGVKVSRNVIRKLLKKHNLVKRKMQRKRSCGKSQDRDAQFKIITAKREKFAASDNPVISVDTKKKELLGNLHRKGKIFCTQALESWDHDYTYLATGKISPHGIYDIAANKAHINIGNSSETADFICDSIESWWIRQGKAQYPKATEILILCDSGGANSYRHHLFKIALQKLATATGLTVNISHYPPYASKWNPIEHRVFPHVTRALAGEPLLSEEDAKLKIASTKTTTGLCVTSDIISKVYETGKKATKAMVEKLNIKFDETLGQFNYVVSPQTT